MATGPALFRRPAERELVRDIVKEAPTIEGALKTLEDILDPPIHQYQMVQELCRSDWETGNQIDDYFLEIRRDFPCWSGY